MTTLIARGVLCTRRCCSYFAVALLGCAFLALGCATTEKRLPTAFTEERWAYAKLPGTKLITAHYEIHTTLQDETLTRALPDVIERAYDHYQSFVKPVSPPSEKMKVYIFASRDQWEHFTRKFTGPRAATYLQVRNGGYEDNGVAVIQYVSHGSTFPILTHEGFHQYLDHCVNQSVPAWLNEGLATLCEGQRWDGWELERFDGSYNPMRENDLAEALVNNKLLPLRTILSTHAGKVVAGPMRNVTAYYGQVWALMLFLQDGEGGKYRAKFRRLLDDLPTQDLERQARAAYIWSDSREFSYGESLFRSYISDDLGTTENEYLAFMRERFLTHK